MSKLFQQMPQVASLCFNDIEDEDEDEDEDDFDSVGSLDEGEKSPGSKPSPNPNV